MTNPKYSFIMPVYKKTYLANAIDSILGQSYKDFELIIVNDASPEDILSVIERYSDNRIKYYTNEENIGGESLVKQWNHCLSFANGEYVILATDDDEYLPDYLEKMNYIVERYPNVHAFRPRIMHHIEGASQKTSIECYMPEFSPRDLFLYFFLKRYIFTGIGFWIFRRSELLEIGGYQEMPAAWFADDVTVMTLAKNGVGISNDVLFKFRIHEQSISDQHNNDFLLSKKLQAHCMFERYYKELFKLNSVENDIISDTTLMTLADSLNKSIWIYDICKSSKKAILKNSRLIFKTSKISRFGTIKLIVSKLLH